MVVVTIVDLTRLTNLGSKVAIQTSGESCCLILTTSLIA